MLGPREPIYQAIFARAQAAYAWGESSRRLKLLPDTASYPALFQMQLREVQDEKARGIPPRWRLSVDLYAYVRVEPGAVHTQQLNPIIDALEQAFAPSPGTGVLDLGLPTRVSQCRIEGEVQVIEGVLGEFAVAIVPVVAVVV